MRYYVYKTTNLIDSKYYIGVHKTEDPNDDYLGSGVHLKRAVDKYGREAFHREILFEFKTEEEAYLKEAEIVNQQLVESRDCYNITLGGVGGFYHINSKERINPMEDPKTVQKHVANRRKNGTYHTEKCVSARSKSLEKAVEKNTGTKHSKQWNENIRVGIKSAMQREDVIKRMEEGNEKRRKRYEITSPEGEIFRTDNVSVWCEEMGFAISTVTTHTNGATIKRGKMKGWTVSLIEK